MVPNPTTDKKMLITVAICTWNRADSLDRTLMQLRSLRIPTEVDWELLVVNNNSTDHTDQVIERHAQELPIRRLFEGTPGKSYACNLAVRETRGELLLWTDDDVLVDSGWLEAYVTAALSHPHVSFFGGRIDPWYEDVPPSWFNRNLKHFGKVVALLDFGPLVRLLEPDEKVIGANMAFRSEAQRRYQYDTLLTTRPGRQASCEDHELIDRMRVDGRQGLWVANAIVQHFIPRARSTTQFARRWWSEQAQVYVDRFPAACPAVNGRAPLWLRRKYFEATFRTWFYSLTRGERWAKAFFEAAWLHGLIFSCTKVPTSRPADGEPCTTEMVAANLKSAISENDESPTTTGSLTN